MSTRRPSSPAAFVLVLLLGAASTAWWMRRPERLPPPPAAPSLELAPVLPPEPTPEPAAVPVVTAKALGAVGFCAPEGDEGSVTIHHTLRGLVRKELLRRWDLLSNDERRSVDADKDAIDRLDPTAKNTTTSLLLAAMKSPASPQLLAAATRIAEQTPSDGYVQATRAFLADDLNLDDVQLEALRRARTILPHDPAIGWSLFALLRDSPALDEAITAVGDYLAADPSPAIGRMRARAEVQRDIQREYRRTSAQGVTLLWPAEVLNDTQSSAVLSAVSSALDEAATLTGTPRRSKLTVVVYPGREELLAVSCVQTWAGALYDGTLRLVAGAGDATGVGLVSLRHESLHAQVIPFAPSAPRWFHEGLAQSFAGEVDRALPTWRLMVRNRSWIPFASLGGTFQAFEESNDARLAYAQSLALIELLEETGGTRAIQDALHAFQAGAETEAALTQAAHHEITGNDLLKFLEHRLTPSGEVEDH